MTKFLNSLFVVFIGLLCDGQSITIKFNELKKVCTQPIDIGPCDALIIRWGYNPSLRDCVRFAYGGCEGNANNFLSMADCQRICKRLQDPYIRNGKKYIFEHKNYFNLPKYSNGKYKPVNDFFGVSQLYNRDPFSSYEFWKRSSKPHYIDLSETKEIRKICENEASCDKVAIGDDNTKISVDYFNIGDDIDRLKKRIRNPRYASKIRLHEQSQFLTGQSKFLMDDNFESDYAMGSELDELIFEGIALKSNRTKKLVKRKPFLKNGLGNKDGMLLVKSWIIPIVTRKTGYVTETEEGPLKKSYRFVSKKKAKDKIYFIQTRPTKIWQFAPGELRYKLSNKQHSFKFRPYNKGVRSDLSEKPLQIADNGLKIEMSLVGLDLPVSKLNNEEKYNRRSGILKRNYKRISEPSENSLRWFYNSKHGFHHRRRNSSDTGVIKYRFYVPFLNN